MALELGQNYHIISHRGSGLYLNIYGDEVVKNSSVVCLYPLVPHAKSQMWAVRAEKGYAKIYTALAGGDSYALNISSKSNPVCTMYTASGNDRDSLVDLLTVDRDKNLYRIKLVGYDLYLLATGEYSLALATWSPVIEGSDAFIWKLEREDILLPDPTLPLGKRPLNHNTSSPFYNRLNPFYTADPALVGQCTWYAWGRISEIFGGEKQALFSQSYNRHAKNWPATVTNAIKMPYPAKGDAIIWGVGTYGHVGVVEEVMGDRVKFTQCNGKGSVNNAWDAKDGIVQELTQKQLESLYPEFITYLHF
ncbi:MAG: CHAP domain-containing protein [Oscillospiraceae bacterium]